MKNELWAFIAEDEGIVAAKQGEGWFPLVTWKPSLVPKMREAAIAIAAASGKEIKLHHFVLESVEDLK